jgi:DNA repair protein RadC
MRPTDSNTNEQRSRSHSDLKWRHPGGKLRELGADKLTDAELLSILISIGIKGRSAEEIAEDILLKFGSFKGMANQPLRKFLEIKGLGDVKIIRIAAAFEIARRIVNQVLEEHEKEE